MNRNELKMVRIFLFFISFHCSQLFYCSSCPTPASLNMYVVSTNFAKTLCTNVNMTSYSDVTSSVYPVTRPPYDAA